MSGIVGYVRSPAACGVVIDALGQMGYRGYDFARVTLVNSHEVDNAHDVA